MYFIFSPVNYLFNVGFVSLLGLLMLFHHLLLLKFVLYAECLSDLLPSLIIFLNEVLTDDIHRLLNKFGFIQFLSKFLLCKLTLLFIRIFSLKFPIKPWQHISYITAVELCRCKRSRSIWITPNLRDHWFFFLKSFRLISLLLCLKQRDFILIHLRYIEFITFLVLALFEAFGSNWVAYSGFGGNWTVLVSVFWLGFCHENSLFSY